MSWVIFIWAATAGACMIMAFLHVLVWLNDRRSWASLCFAAAVFGVIGLAAGELITMYTDSPEVFARAIRWAHLVYAIGVIGSLGFVHFYFGTGRRWLLALAVGLRVLVQVPNFATGVNLQFSAIHSLQKVSFLGEPVSVLRDSAPNPWLGLAWLAALVQLTYIVDASLRLWRTGTRESRQRALIMGGALAFFIVFAVMDAGLTASGVLHMPFTVSFPFFVVLLAMSYELSCEMLRAAQQGRELQERELQMTLTAEAAHLGLWSRDTVRNEYWANARCRELLGFTPSERVDVERFLQQVHPKDREAVREAMTRTVRGNDFEIDFRVGRPDGGIGWIASRGRVYADARGRPVLVRGVSFEITQRKEAEEAAHNLAGRLIHAQEEERMRLARELHDDLSQSLALLSMDLELASQRPPASRDQLNAWTLELSGRVRDLSSAVHRMSHELHPAKLKQLGLAAALRGFCREIGAAHEFAIHFEAGDLPRPLPDEVVLCFYRIAQEALQNVVKHSNATSAHVTLTVEGDEIRLVIDDDGAGFDPQAVQGKASLGLVSMRERVRLVRGQLSLESRKGEGTRVAVRVPLAPSS